MLTFKEKEIIRLRRNGESLKDIATSLEMPLGSVKSFVARNDIQPYTEGYCKQCGVKVTHTEHKKKKQFCSDECRMRWWNRHGKYSYTHTFTCKHCNKVFIKHRNDKPLYCSHACYIADRFGGKNEHS